MTPAQHTLYRLLTGRPLVKAEQLGLFGAGTIKQSGKNRLGLDKRGRTHWVSNAPAPTPKAKAPMIEQAQQSIPATLAQVGREMAEEAARIGAALDRLPVGTKIKGWEKIAIPGETVGFWTKGRRGVTSSQLFIETGKKALVPLVGNDVLGLHAVATAPGPPAQPMPQDRYADTPLGEHPAVLAPSPRRGEYSVTERHGANLSAHEREQWVKRQREALAGERKAGKVAAEWIGAGAATAWGQKNRAGQKSAVDALTRKKLDALDKYAKPAPEPQSAEDPEKAARRAAALAKINADRERFRQHEAWCEDFAQRAVEQRKAIRWDSASGLEYLLVTRDTHPDSPGWRVTRFDPRHGPTGHATGATPGKALLEALTATRHRDEVRLVPAAEFDAMTRTPEFLHATRRVGLLQQLNRLVSLSAKPENEPKQEQLAVHWRQASDALAAQDLDAAERHLRAGLEHGRIVKAVLFCKARRRDVVTMPRDELIEEHEHLLGVLRSPSRTDDRVEAKKQARELAAYRRGKRKRLVLKAHVKAFTRTNPKTGQTVQVREHEDKRMAARPTMGTPRQAAAAPTPPAPRYPAPQQQTPQHRYATIHTAGPDSPGHAVRLQPHPQKAGVWQLHPDDKERVRHLMTPPKPGQQQPAPQQASPAATQAAPKAIPLDELCGIVQGCEDNAEVGGRVPKNIGVVRQLVTRARATIAGILGNIGDDRNNAPTYRNAAGTVDELLADAKGAEQSLRDIVGAAADASGGEANFGPGGKFALKSPDSLRRKVKDRVEASGKSEADVVANISDAVRGTVICDRPDQLRKSIESLRAHVQKVGGKVFIDNKWDEDHPFGYAGVHADLHIPVGKEGRRIRAEVQLHLRTINDGTMECVKEQSHRFYEKLREPGFHAVEAATGASLLMYLSAMQPFVGG